MRSVKGDCLLTLFQTWRSVSISLSCWRMQTTMLLHGGLKPQLRQDFDDGGTYSVLRWGVRVLEQIYSIMCTYIYIDNITTYNISYIYMNYNVCILYIHGWIFVTPWNAQISFSSFISNHIQTSWLWQWRVGLQCPTPAQLLQTWSANHFLLNKGENSTLRTWALVSQERVDPSLENPPKCHVKCHCHVVLLGIFEAGTWRDPLAQRKDWQVKRHGDTVIDGWNCLWSFV